MKAVSVIIPAFNCSKWLGNCIESCIKQKEYLQEIIIIDDFSTDNSWQVIKDYVRKYKGLVKAYKNKSKGGNNARNLGFEMSSGEHIQWLDADDTILILKFKNQIDCLERTNSDIVYSSGYLNTYSASGELVKKELMEAKVYEDYLLELLKDNWLPPHAYLLKRETAFKLHKLYAWNPETKIAQDREYFTMAAIIGTKFVFAPGSFFEYNRRFNELSVSRKLKVEERAGLITSLLHKFRSEIVNSTAIKSNAKGVYEKVINTQIIYNCSLYKLKYNTPDFSFFDVQWNLIKGYRSKLKMLYHLLAEKQRK